MRRLPRQAAITGTAPAVAGWRGGADLRARRNAGAVRRSWTGRALRCALPGAMCGCGAIVMM